VKLVDRFESVVDLTIYGRRSLDTLDDSREISSWSYDTSG
jgi:hypothetical protein